MQSIPTLTDNWEAECSTRLCHSMYSTDSDSQHVLPCTDKGNISLARGHREKYAHTHARTHAHTHTPTHTQAQAHAHAHKHVHTHKSTITPYIHLTPAHTHLNLM